MLLSVDGYIEHLLSAWSVILLKHVWLQLLWKLLVEESNLVGHLQVSDDSLVVLAPPFLQALRAVSSLFLSLRC